MKPIKFLEPEIAERIEKIASKFINQNPIEKNYQSETYCYRIRT